MPVEVPPVSYLDALIEALRAVGRHLEVTRRWLSSAEEEDGSPAWRLQALAAARAEHAEATAWLAIACARLIDLGDDLPAALAPLPARLDAMRADLQSAEDRLLCIAASTRPLGHG